MCGNVLALGPRRRDTILFFSGGSYPPRTYCFQVSNDLSYSFFFFFFELFPFSAYLLIQNQSSRPLSFCILQRLLVFHVRQT